MTKLLVWNCLLRRTEIHKGELCKSVTTGGIDRQKRIACDHFNRARVIATTGPSLFEIAPTVNGSRFDHFPLEEIGLRRNRSTEVERFLQPLTNLEFSTTSRSSATKSTAHCFKSASDGVKVLPVPVPISFANVTPGILRATRRPRAICRNAKGTALLRTVKM